MTKAPKAKDVRSPKRGAFPVPEDVLAAAAPYHPREPPTERPPGAPKNSALDAKARRRSGKKPET